MATRWLGGLGLVALGVALQVRAGLGADPWTVFHEGVAAHTPLSHGARLTAKVAGWVVAK